jgi:PAS domain S-box-containing protein
MTTRDGAPAHPVQDIRLDLILSVERIALISRYAIYLVLAPFFWMGWIEGSLPNLILATVLVLAHNLYAHVVFYTRRYGVFLSAFNFALYLAEASILTYLTGADSSDGYILYLLLIVGLSAYHRRFGPTMAAALACCAAYGIVLFAEWWRYGLSESPGNLMARFLFTLVCGWLVGSVSGLLRRSEAAVRRQAEALAASEASLRTILDSAAEPILVFDEQEFIVEVNKRACEFAGVGREELLGRRVRSFLFDDGTLPSKFASLRARGEYHGEQIVIKNDGEERTVDFRVRSYVRDGRRYFVAVANDITEQRDLQEATRLANANLERLNRELRSVDQLKTAFLVTISQKLRSPLSAVLGFVEMLLQEELGSLSAEQRSALQTCRRATLRVFRLIDEALELRFRERPGAELAGLSPRASETNPSPPPEATPSPAPEASTPKPR